MTARWVFAISVMTWCTIAAIAIACSPPLGHDESQYAVAARSDRSPWLYLSPGTVGVARVGVALGGADWAMRLAPCVLGVGLLVATWCAGRAMFDERVGAWATAVIAGAHPLALRNTEILSDLPAAACLLAALALCVRELDRGPPRWRIVAVAPALAAAFYLRYGSAPVIAILCLAAVVLWWRSIRARPGPIVATALAFAALLVPHLVHAHGATGSPLGILLFSAGMPYERYLGEGLVTYVTSNPFMFYGFVVAPLMIVGLVALVRPPARWRPTVFAAAVAVGQFVVLGLQTRAQPRYVCVATVLLVILGVAAIVRAAPSPRLRPLLVVVPLAWLGAVIAIAPMSQHLARVRAPIELAARAVRIDAAGRPCVVAALDVPLLMWRTGCTGVIASARTLWPPERRRYVVSVPHRTVVITGVSGAAGATAVGVPSERAPRIWYLP